MEKLPDSDNITLAQVVQHAVQLQPVPAPAGGGFLEDAAAADGVEGLGLHGIALLVAFEDAGVAEQHAPLGDLLSSQTGYFANDRVETANGGKSPFKTSFRTHPKGNQANTSTSPAGKSR
jgi:hypothetical protein